MFFWVRVIADRPTLIELETTAQQSLIKLGELRQKYRLACQDKPGHGNDYVCNQKMDCYLTDAVATQLADSLKLVRCPYGDWAVSSSVLSSLESDEASSTRTISHSSA